MSSVESVDMTFFAGSEDLSLNDYFSFEGSAERTSFEEIFSVDYHSKAWSDNIQLPYPGWDRCMNTEILSVDLDLDLDLIPVASNDLHQPWKQTSALSSPDLDWPMDTGWFNSNLKPDISGVPASVSEDTRPSIKTSLSVVSDDPRAMERRLRRRFQNRASQKRFRANKEAQINEARATIRLLEARLEMQIGQNVRLEREYGRLKAAVDRSGTSSGDSPTC